MLPESKLNHNVFSLSSLTLRKILVILQMRIYALYSLNKKILALMVVCFIAASTASAVVMGTALSRITGIVYHSLLHGI